MHVIHIDQKLVIINSKQPSHAVHIHESNCSPVLNDFKCSNVFLNNFLYSSKRQSEVSGIAMKVNNLSRAFCAPPPVI